MDFINTLQEFWESFGGQILAFVVATGGIGATFVKIASIITTLVKTNKDAITNLMSANETELNDLKDQIIELKELIVQNNIEQNEAQEIALLSAVEERKSEIEEKQEKLMKMIEQSRGK